MNSLIVWSRADVLCAICRFIVQRGDKIKPRLVDPILKKFVTKMKNKSLSRFSVNFIPDITPLPQQASPKLYSNNAKDEKDKKAKK